MKIFGFFVGKSKRLMALVIVLVLLASAVGVAASEATEPEDVPDLRDEKKKNSFTLEHYGPYYEPKKGERWKAGDLVATLRDEDRGIQNEEIVFFVDQFYDDPMWDPFGTVSYARESLSPALKVHKSNILGFGMTNKDGVATWNYFFYENIDPSDIAARIRLLGYGFEDKIGAAVYDFKGSGVIIKDRKSITVEFPSVARITKVSVHGRIEEIKREEKKVRVMREGEGTKAVYDKDATPPGGMPSVAKCTPYDLLPGDIILLDRNDYVELLWLGGLKMSIKTKPDILKEDTAKVTIGETDLADKLWARKVYAVTRHGLFSTVTLGGAGLAIGFSHPVPAAVLGGSQIVMWILQWWTGETPFVVNEMESTVLVDFDETEVTFYTVEGTNRLINPKDSSTINITTGHKISVSSDGTFGQVLEFDSGELSDDLIYILDAIQEGSIETSIEGLTFESRSKPTDSSVQIPLTLNGIEEKIGNMDITLSYDSSVLEATAVTKGDLTTDSLFEYNIMAGTIKICLADAEGFSGNGSVAYVTFDVIGAEGSTSPLQIAALAANRAKDYEALTIPTYDGVFRVIFISTEESGGFTVSVSDTTGAKGSTVEVPINLEGATEVGSMDIVLNYDANVLSAVYVEAGALGKNALIEANTARDGEVIIALADSSGINGDGAVASVAFEVIGDAGTTSSLTLEEVLVHNLDLGEIIPTTVNGTFLVI